MSRLLHELSVNSIERNTPLVGCFYKHRDSKIWREIFPSYKIAKKSYNNLGEAWTNTEVFCWKPNEDN